MSLNVESLTDQFTVLFEDHARVDPEVWQRAGQAMNQRSGFLPRANSGTACGNGCVRDWLVADDPAGLSRTSTALARPEYAHAIPTTMVVGPRWYSLADRLRATRSLGSSHPWPSSGTPEQRRSPGTFDAALPSTRPSPAGGRRSRRPIMSRFAATGCWVPRRSARSC